MANQRPHSAVPSHLFFYPLVVPEWRKKLHGFNALAIVTDSFVPLQEKPGSAHPAKLPRGDFNVKRKRAVLARRTPSIPHVAQRPHQAVLCGKFLIFLLGPPGSLASIPLFFVPCPLSARPENVYNLLRWKFLEQT
jgi:hypothetical protein